MRIRPLAFVILGVSAFACGIDVRGVAPAADGGASDGGGEAGTEGRVVTDGGDGQDTVGFDAGVADAACTPTLIDDSLGAIDPNKWIVQETNNSDRPAPIQSGSRKIVSMIGGDRDSARGALFLAKAVPTKAFDVQFRFAVDCSTNWFNGGCADGMAVSWTDVSALAGGSLASAIANAGNGQGFGIPNALAGGAVGIDIYRNASDPDTPAIEILALDGKRTPGTYPWIVQSASGNYGGAYAHTMLLHFRGGLLTVSVDNKPLLSNVAVPATSTSAFGFSAGTGGENGVFYVWEVHAAFYGCDP